MELNTTCPMCGSTIRVTTYQPTDSKIVYAECPICHSICNATINNDLSKRKEALSDAKDSV